MDYKEMNAIGIVRLMLTDGVITQEVAGKYFPELKENDDERIKNVLIDYFNRYKEQEECGVKTFYGIPTDNIIAWLEKQGEQKPAWSEEDKNMLQSILDEYKSMPIEKRNWLKSIKDR
jgi:hypothetical protein